MPHTILEYSDTIVDRPDFQALWAQLHPALAAAAHCRLQDIKSRAIRCETFRMGDGAPGQAFVHLTIRLLEGREPETLARVGQGALAILREHFPLTLAQRRCDLTVELAGMRRDSYFKASGSPD
jgi:5-carboxymethyl-2-hydroxymuconate isomerase